MEPFSKTVAVYGSSAITQDSAEAQNAEQLGKRLAEEKLQICNGGYHGAMEACSRGARQAGGQIAGVVCSAFSGRTPNPYLTQVVEADSFLDRIAALMRMADAYVVLDGNIGTMAELFLAWNLAAVGGSKPVLVVGEEMKQAILGLQERTEINAKQISMLTFVETVDEAAEWLNRYFGIA
jgi:uncharacterized protein (TIGR00730 family)